MPPKKEKDRTDDSYWRTFIEETPLNEEFWHVKVMLFEIAGGEQEIIYLNRFEGYAKEEKRFVVKNICKSETIFMINQLGADKKVRDDNLRVFEEGYLFLKEKKDIPPDILALIIKHLILKMKEEYISIQRQKLVVREGMRNESMIMIDRLEIKNKVPMPVAEPPPTESTQIKSKGKKGEDIQPLPPQPEEGKKYNTLLRERGEEWRDKVYVDDYPLDGPNLYVAITGFLDPYLLQNLIKIGVPLTALVQIRINPAPNVMSSGYLTGTKRGHSATELAAEKAHVFWETLQELRLHKISASTYNDMAFIVFNPPYNTDDTLSSSSEKIYDELSYLMYDIQDLTRQHSHYLNNMDVKIIPIEAENNNLFKSYHNRINIIHLECVTIFTIIDIMLQTINTECAENVKNSRSSLTTAETFLQQSPLSNNDAEKAETLVNKVFAILSKTDQDRKKYRLTCGELIDKFENPIIINYGDFTKLKSFHIDNINIDDFILSTLTNMPFCNLWKNQKILSDDLKAKANFHINNLISCFDREDLDDSLLNRLIHILSFRKLYNNRSSLRNETIAPSTITEFKKIYLKRSMFAEPLLKSVSFINSSATSPSNPFTIKSDSYCQEFSNEIETEEEVVKYLFSCPDLSELVSAAEILNNKPLSNFVDEFDYFEDFTGINALQMLFEAFVKFNCLNYKYCEVTDSFEIMFFNDHNDDGISRNEWRCHLPTPVCLQDFYDFVFEEQYDWIQEEEKIYDEITALKTKLEWKESLDQVPAKTCIENIDEINSELLILGSLKYQERFQSDYLSSEEIDQNQSVGKSPESTPLTEPDTKNINKNKLSKNQENKKQMKEATIDINDDTISDNIKCNKPFSGYDLGNRRVEVFGRDSFYFAKDGSKISSFYTITIPMNLEHLILHVAFGKGENEFCMNKILGDTQSFNRECNPESFRIYSKDRVMMYLRKNFYEVSKESIPTPPFKKLNVRESFNKINVKRSSSTNVEATSINSYNSFIITWPNGLIIESVHESNSPAISHIKQYFINPPQNTYEDMRCVTLHGEVIVFKKSGCVEIFQPDGTFINITKCVKKAINLEVTEDVQSNVSSDKGKNKKGKGIKSKDKLKGTTSKSSKSTLDQNPMPEIPIQYELIIDEFEIIDANGLKQKWINDHLFSTENVLTRTAVDYCLGEVLTRRMDGTSMLLNKDGVQVISFHDNTRIITTCFVENEEIYSELNESDQNLTKSNIFESNRASKISLSQKSQASATRSLNSNNNISVEEETVEVEQNKADGFVSVQVVYTVEHSNFATVVIDNAKGTINVESANRATLSIDKANNFNFHLDQSTSASFDGEYLDIIFKSCHLCHSCSKFKIKIDDIKSNGDINPYWVSVRDSFGKNIVVDEEGGINLIQEPNKEEAYAKKGKMSMENVSQTCLTLQGKCRELYEANMFRFFVFSRNLTCSELVHRVLIDEYKSQCRWQPWCSINEYDTFGDHRTLISILTPIHLTETEKWLMQSKYTNKPKQLKYKDLKVDTGKGFYHWMRPYERFQPQPTEVENIELPRLPRAYVLRTLEQLWNEEERDKFKGGKEIVWAVLRYRRLMESDLKTILNIPIRDPRTESEKSIDDKLQDIAQSIYNDLKNRIADDIQVGAQPSITTKASKPPQYLLGDKGEVTCDDLKKTWEEKSAAYVRQVEEVEKPNPNLERYWRRRAEEAKEEEFYKQLLREESIPPYFRNILGGAAWSEVERIASGVVTRKQAAPCKCVKSDTDKAQKEQVRGTQSQ